MKVSVIFGTRPEAIKLAPVILAMQRDARFDCRICVTAQHREMLDQALQVFGIVPGTDLNLMRTNQSLSSLTARVLEKLAEYLAIETPDLVLVQGDTTTAFCAALASFYRQIPVAHVEAGLRTGNMDAPFPEEANRVMTSRLTRLHFAPTEESRANLLKEHVPPETIFVTGNTGIDALFLVLEKVRKTPPPIPGLPAGTLNDQRRMILITGHRRENFGAGFESICNAIGELATRFPDVQFVYPLHLNPNVREPVGRILSSTKNQNIHLVEPLSYPAFVSMMDRATLILTDSGGIQEEAPSLGKPVLVMRETTERPEAIAAGAVLLVGTDRAKIVAEVSRLLEDSTAYKAMAQSGNNPYGDGKAASRILDACAAFAPKR